MEQGKVLALQISTQSGQPMSPLEEANAISGVGLEGDRHAERGNPRQVLLMDKETLDMLALTTGVIKENITLEGIDLSSVKPGNVFFIGEDVTLEATGLCEPCGRMDMLRPGLQEALQERRGVLAVVLNGGKLRVGDNVRLEP